MNVLWVILLILADVIRLISRAVARAWRHLFSRRTYSYARLIHEVGIGRRWCSYCLRGLALLFVACIGAMAVFYSQPYEPNSPRVFGSMPSWFYSLAVVAYGIMARLSWRGANRLIGE